MRDAARIQASTKAQGNAGNIIINTAGDINSDNNNSSNNLILSQVLSGAEGDAGNIEITAGGSLVLDNTFIIADSKDRGSSGDITIDVAETITLRGDAPVREDGLTILPSAIITGLDEERDGEPGNRVLRSSGQGRAGDINVSARELIVRDLGFLSSSTEDTTIGDAGSVTVNVDKLSITDNGSIGSFTENTTEGKFDAGSINVNARIVELLRGGKIIVATDGDGDAGNINLNVSESLTIDGSGEPSLFSDLVALDEPLIRELQGETGLFAQASQRATGDGGNINIGAGEITPDGDGFNFEIAQPTGEVNVLNQGIITADSQGTGSGGQIFIRAENLALNNQGEIAAVTKFSQDEETEDASQNIVLRIGDTLTLDNNSLISARAFNDANGGNIDLAAKFIIANSSDGDGNDIIASAEQGSGGNIDIATIAIFGLQEREANQGNNTNDIDVSSDFGTDGSVSIESPDVESIQIELPSNIIEPDNYVAQVCAADSIAANSSFVIKGKGGIPPLPTEALSSDSLIIDGKLSALEGENQAQNSPKTQYQAIATDEGNIYPARGVIVREDGTVTLTAYPIPDDTQRTLVASRNCQANH